MADEAGRWKELAQQDLHPPQAAGAVQLVESQGNRWRRRGQQRGLHRASIGGVDPLRHFGSGRQQPQTGRESLDRIQLARKLECGLPTGLVNAREGGLQVRQTPGVLGTMVGGVQRRIQRPAGLRQTPAAHTADRDGIALSPERRPDRFRLRLGALQATVQVDLALIAFAQPAARMLLPPFRQAAFVRCRHEPQLRERALGTGHVVPAEPRHRHRRKFCPNPPDTSP